jgi:hypothetical protein
MMGGKIRWVRLLVMRQQPDAPKLRRFELFLFLAWGLATLLFSIHVIGAKLFLIYLYGWSRVHQEQLSILKMQKGSGPWLVSNGDLIVEGHFVHFLVSLGCWFVLFFGTYPFIRLLLPRRRS